MHVLRIETSAECIMPVHMLRQAGLWLTYVFFLFLNPGIRHCSILSLSFIPHAASLRGGCIVSLAVVHWLVFSFSTGDYFQDQWRPCGQKDR